MTLRDLAGRLEVSVGTMSAIENNKVAVTVERLNAVAAVLGVTAGALLAGDTFVRPTARGDDDWRHFADLDLDPVLAAAVEVFTETGYHGATMRVRRRGGDQRRRDLSPLPEQAAATRRALRRHDDRGALADVGSCG